MDGIHFRVWKANFEGIWAANRQHLHVLSDWSTLWRRQIYPDFPENRLLSGTSSGRQEFNFAGPIWGGNTSQGCEGISATRVDLRFSPIGRPISAWRHRRGGAIVGESQCSCDPISALTPSDPPPEYYPAARGRIGSAGYLPGR